MSKDSKIIERIRKDCGHRLALLGHHYQSDEVIRHMDLTGDSLELARKIQGLDAEYIVFCGVYFMAETAAILAQDEQKVLLPAADASCVMADTAPAAYVRGVLERLAAKGRRIVPQWPTSTPRPPSRPSAANTAARSAPRQTPGSCWTGP